MKTLSLCAFSVSFMFAIAPKAAAGAPSFTTIDYPGAVFTAATDINAKGEICGVFIDTSGIFHGFFLGGSGVSAITFPGAAFTAALGLNRNGDIVGAYRLEKPYPGDGKGLHGFLLRAGVFSTIDVPGAVWTRAIGINRAGDVVGTWSDVNNGKQHGYVLSGGVFSIIDFPGSTETGAWKINDSGQIAGRYRSGTDDKYHVFQLNAGAFTVLADFPGAAQVAPSVFCAYHSGQNNLGDVVSVYSDASSNGTSENWNETVMERTHGYLVRAGAYTSIDFPGAVGTVAWGINDTRLIVGAYQDPAGTIRGFLRVP